VNKDAPIRTVGVFRNPSDDLKIRRSKREREKLSSTQRHCENEQLMMRRRTPERMSNNYFICACVCLIVTTLRHPVGIVLCIVYDRDGSTSVILSSYWLCGRCQYSGHGGRRAIDFFLLKYAFVQVPVQVVHGLTREDSKQIVVYTCQYVSLTRDTRNWK
jgi:hypothetical protein